MDVLYCGDSRMRDGLLISLLSLIDQSSDPVNAYVLTASIRTDDHVWDPITAGDIAYLDALVKKSRQGGSVTLIDISRQFHDEPPTANMKTRFSPYCMLRLYSDLVDLPDRILYLDTDVICRKDPIELFTMDMGKAQIAGIPDHYGRLMPTAGLTLPGNYVNSGVLLLNMAAIYDSGLFAKCRRMCQAKRMFLCDQTAINRLARDRKILPRRYNEQIKTRKNTVLRHFTTTLHALPFPHTQTVKPWDIDRVHDVLDEYDYDFLFLNYKFHISQMNALA
mgnify:FL=1